MPYHSLEEELDGSIVIYDRHKQEVARFEGRAALENALHWAKQGGLRLRIVLSWGLWQSQHDWPRYYVPHSFLLRLRVQEAAQASNIQHIVISSFDFDDEDDYDEDVEYGHEDAYQDGVDENFDDDLPF